MADDVPPPVLNSADKALIDARLAAAVEAIGDGFFSVDRDWRFVAFNQAAEAFFDVSREALLGRALWEVYPQGRGAPFESWCRAAMGGAPAQTYEMESLTRLGRTLEVRVGPMQGGGVAVSLNDITERRRTEAALRAAEQRATEILESVGDAVYAVDADWRFTYLNRHAEAWWKRSRAELVGQVCWDVFPSEVGKPAHHAHLQAAAERRIIRAESYSATFDRWVDTSIHPTADGGLSVYVRDITKRRAAEDRLRESEALFRSMADSAPLPVWVTGETGQIEFVNDAFCEFAGLSFDELMGDAWTRMIHPEDLGAVAGARAAAWIGPNPYEFEARFRNAVGAYRWIRASSKPRLDSEGRFCGFVGVAADLTEVRAAEAALRESEERFRRVAEDAPVMLWMGDTEGRCQYINEALRQFLGREVSQTGLEWTRFVERADARAFYDAGAEALKEQRGFEREVRLRRFDGDIRTLLVRGEPRFDHNGSFMGMIGVNVDVTDSRRAETHQKLLINELNHRVKNTLATVQSIARQTLRDGVVARESREVLTARLLALSSAHNVLTRENWEAAELREIASQAVQPYVDALAPRVDLAGPDVRLSPNMALAFSMALHELCTNALKHGALSAPQGRVEVAWSREAGGGLRLCWQELDGPPVRPPGRKGFGSRLLTQGLTTELGAPAELNYAPEGLHCVIRAQLKNP